MLNPREIEEKLNAVKAIESITVTYQEVSQQKMNEIREKALKNRKFIGELAKLHSAAKSAYLKEEKERRERGEPGEDVFKDKEGEVVVFISANARFYGSLIWKVWRETANYLENREADLVVIGEVGKFLVENNYEGGSFQYFDLDDDDPNEEQARKIINHIKKYEKINIFHGEFKNVLTQKAVKTDISGEISDQSLEETSSYLFEPSPGKVMEFFTDELITAFFNQSFLEHRLSRHATRMVAMHQASSNAEEEIEELKQQKTRTKRQLLDKKQFEITTPYQLWD